MMTRTALYICGVYSSMCTYMCWDVCVCLCVYVESKKIKFLLLLQTDTKPVHMMNMEATFCMGNIDSINCKIIELPFQNKHLSMLILLPKDVEDGSTGLEQVRKEARAQHTGAIGPRGRCLWLLEVTRQPCLTGLLLSGLQGFLGSLGAFLFNIKTGNICLFGTYNVPGTVFPTCTGSSNSHRGPKS